MYDIHYGCHTFGMSHRYEICYGVIQSLRGMAFIMGVIRSDYRRQHHRSLRGMAFITGVTPIRPHHTPIKVLEVWHLLWV